MDKTRIFHTHPVLFLSGLCLLFVSCPSISEDPPPDAQSPTDTASGVKADAASVDSLPSLGDASVGVADIPQKDSTVIAEDTAAIDAPAIDAPATDAPATDAGDVNNVDGNPVPPNLATATLTFPSTDGLPITTDLYIAHPTTAPFIILAHRAGWSRAEYLEIAPKLNDMGFNAMALDLRSGKEKFGVPNATFAAAVAAGKPTLFLDALPDLQAAVSYAKENYAKGKLLLWGSSFAGSLAISVGKESSMIDGLLCFSPGEYFNKMYGKTATWVREEAASLTLPVFMTSKKSEYDEARKAIFQAIPSTNKTYFVPEAEGAHGSEALFTSTPNHAEYWTALSRFLAPWMAGTN